MSADTERLTAAIGRRVRAIAARFRRPAKPHPELYGLLTGRVDSAGVVKERLNKLDASPEACQGNAGLPANWPILLLNSDLINRFSIAQNRRKLTSIKSPVAKL